MSNPEEPLVPCPCGSCASFTTPAHAALILARMAAEVPAEPVSVEPVAAEQDQVHVEVTVEVADASQVSADEADRRSIAVYEENLRRACFT